MFWKCKFIKREIDMIDLNNKNKTQTNIWRCCMKKSDLFYERMCEQIAKQFVEVWKDRRIDG